MDYIILRLQGVLAAILAKKISVKVCVELNIG